MSDYHDYKPGSAYDGGSAEFSGQLNILKPGDELSLTKKDPTMKHIVTGMGWDFRGFDSDPPDLDMCVLLLDKYGQTRNDEDFVFYNNRMGGDGSVRHLGDSRTGAGDGDDEQIELNLATMPFEIIKIVFVLSLYNLDHGLENHNFSMVKNVYFRLVNQDNNNEMFRLPIEVSSVDQGSPGIICGQLERVGSEWIFQAHVESVKGGLAKIAEDCGILVMQNVRS